MEILNKYKKDKKIILKSLHDLQPHIRFLKLFKFNFLLHYYCFTSLRRLLNSKLSQKARGLIPVE